MIKKKISFLVILFISLFLIMLGIYLVNNKPKENIKINTPNISKNLFSVNVPEGIKTEIAYIQNNNYLAIVFENKTNENISSGKLKVVIGNKEIEKRLELLPIGKKAIFKIAVPNELKDTINKSKVTITLNEIKSSNDFSFIDVDKINNTKTNVSVIENDTNINISGINKTGKDLMIGFNPKFLIDALRVIDDEEVDLYLMNAKAPCFIKDEEETYIYLILPVNFSAI